MGKNWLVQHWFQHLVLQLEGCYLQENSCCFLFTWWGREDQRTFRFTLNVQWGLFSSVWLVFVIINPRVINCWPQEGSWLCCHVRSVAGKQEAWWNFEADKGLRSSQLSFIHKQNTWFIQVFYACCCQCMIVFDLIGLRQEVLGLLGWYQKITSFQLSLMWHKFTCTPDIRKGVMKDTQSLEGNTLCPLSWCGPQHCIYEWHNWIY